MDTWTHGVLQSKTPQTYCGQNPNLVTTTTDPLKVTCPDCRQLMRIMNMLPSLGDITRPRGRPIKEK